MSEHVDPKEPEENATHARANNRPRPIERGRRVAAEKTPVEIDPIDEAGEESFPASDPPTWTLGVEPDAKPGKKS